MSQLNNLKVATVLAVLLLCLSTVWPNAVTCAQGGDSIEELKQKVAELAKQSRLTEALPLLEKIVIADPTNTEMHFQLAFALIAQANNTTDKAAQSRLRIRARNEFIKSKELGQKDPLVDALIQALPADGIIKSEFSKDPRVNALMIEAEALFSKGKIDEALKNYQLALGLDPKFYQAALFSGDMFSEKKDFAQAELWYNKAIAIDPTIETAYRYSAVRLMRQGKTEEARDRYIEAFITEPYSKFAVSGLINWGQETKTALAHPKIDIPTEVTFDEKGDAKINLEASAFLNGTSDGSFAWITYGTTRITWRKETFAKTFPGEKYRHSLAEEADALRRVISVATGDQRTKALNPALVKLKELNDSGLLEAYILLARVDIDISRDHPAYLRDNRDKLRRYVREYVLTGGRGASLPKAAARL